MTWKTIDTFTTMAEAFTFIERAETKGISTVNWIIDRGLDGRYSVLDMG